MSPRMSIITFGILTISDSCFRGERSDESGAELKRMIEDPVSKIKESLRGKVQCIAVIPDDELMIMETLIKWSDELRLNVIMTTGGTGFSTRDVTPEATRKVIQRETSGMSFMMLSETLKLTPMAALSRAVCGIRGRSLIINLPGSLKATRECFIAVAGIIPHAVDLLLDEDRKISGFHSSLQQDTRHDSYHEMGKVKAVRIIDRARDSPYPMISFEECQRILKESVEGENSTVRLNIWDSLGRVLAETVYSKCHLPPFRASIKDGYAVIADDGAGKRKVLGSSVAGRELGQMRVVAGSCIRINTGAPVPDGATAVVQVEDTKLLRIIQEEDEEDEIEILVEPKEGQDIRPIGSDIKEADPVLEVGTQIGSFELGILAACACSDVLVTRIPKIGVLSTGDELQNIDEISKPGHVYDSNKISLIMLLKENGFHAIDLGTSTDQETAMVLAIKKALEQVEVIITTGSVSMGDRDLLKPILIEEFGAKIHFGRVNLKPGKPTTFATCVYNGEKKYFLCLPGNPVSAMVTAHLFVLPLLKYATKNHSEPIVVEAKVTSRYLLDSRPEFVRVALRWSEDSDHPRAFSTGNQSSSRLLSCKNTNALLMLPAKTPEKWEISEGTLVPALLLKLSQKSI